MRVLDEADVTRLLPMDTAIETMRTAFRALGRGEVTAPPRHFDGLAPWGPDAAVASMAAHVGGDVDIAAVKLVTIVPDNAGRDLPGVQAVVVGFDGSTGSPLGAVAATALTGIRTAAVSGLATDLLARSDAHRLAVLGTGVQGRAHVAAVRAVRPVDHVVLWNRTRERAVALAEELRADGLRVDVAATPADAAVDADVICTCTAATEPLLTAADLPDGVHVNAVGSFTPEMAELTPDAVAASWVVVDTASGAWEEAGELLRAVAAGVVDRDVVRAELADLVLHRTAAPVAATTLFCSVGHAAEDAVAAAHLLRA